MEKKGFVSSVDEKKRRARCRTFSLTQQEVNEKEFLF